MKYISSFGWTLDPLNAESYAQKEAAELTAKRMRAQGYDIKVVELNSYFYLQLQGV